MRYPAQQPHRLLRAVAIAIAFSFAVTPEALALTPAQAAVAAVEQVCLPLLKGADIRNVAATAGLDRRRDAWTLPINGDERVLISPPGGANPHICTATLTFAVGGQQPIVSALDGWANAQTPPFQKVKDREGSRGPLHMRTTSSWYAQAPGETRGVVLSEEKQHDGRPAAGDLDQATLLVTVMPG